MEVVLFEMQDTNDGGKHSCLPEQPLLRGAWARHLTTLEFPSLAVQTVFCPQVRDEETQVSGGKGEEDTKEQEPWIGVVPVEMDDSKASTGNQESFADAMVNKVRSSVYSKAVAKFVHAGSETQHPLC